jgi:hypothetical protein
LKNVAILLAMGYQFFEDIFHVVLFLNFRPAKIRDKSTQWGYRV